MPTSLDNFARAFQAAYDSQLRAAAQAAELRLRDLALAQEAAKTQQMMQLEKEKLDLTGRKVQLLEEEERRKQESYEAMKPVMQQLLARMTESNNIKKAMDLVKQNVPADQIKAMTGVDVNLIRENTVDYALRLAQRGDVEAANTIAVTYGMPFLFGFDKDNIVATFGDGRKIRIAMGKQFDPVENIMRLVSQLSGVENKGIQPAGGENMGGQAPGGENKASPVNLPTQNDSAASVGQNVAKTGTSRPVSWGGENRTRPWNTSAPGATDAVNTETKKNIATGLDDYGVPGSPEEISARLFPPLSGLMNKKLFPPLSGR